MQQNDIEKLVMSNAPNEDIAANVCRAVLTLFEKDEHLLKVDASERSINHRLAMHLTDYFSDYHVDCEYNREGHEIKRLLLNSRRTQTSDTDGSRIYPDIIVHRRGKEDNLFVIEIKKSTSAVKNDHDIAKLCAFKEELKYKYAVFLRFTCNKCECGLEEVRWIT